MNIRDNAIKFKDEMNKELKMRVEKCNEDQLAADWKDRKKGRGFMKRIKDQWDQLYPICRWQENA